MANVFVGFPVPAGDWFEAIGSPPGGARRVAPADLHMTLAFLGAIEADRARAAFESIRPMKIGPFEIGLGAIVAMGHPKRFGALAVEVEILSPDAPAVLETVTSARDRVLEAAGRPPEDRAMMLHVTLARIGRKARPEERERALAWAGSESPVGIQLPIERIALYTARRSGIKATRTRSGGASWRAYEIRESRDLAVGPTRDRCRDPIHPARARPVRSGRE